MLKRATLKDVALAASVSKTTASMTLNGKGVNKIPSSTRERVLAAAAELQFRPHGVARALVRRRADVLGVVCTLNPFVELAHHAFEQALLSSLFYHALESGYNPMIYGAPPAEVGEEAILLYTDGRSDAFILLYPEQDSKLLECLPKQGIAVVALCCRVDGALWVDSDHRSGIRAAMDHLIEMGHRRIAYLIDPSVDPSQHARVVAFQESLEEHRIPVHEDWIVSYQSGETSIEKQLTRLFAGTEHPTALLAWNDFAAGEIYEAARNLGWRIPEDLSVVGFDDISTARVAMPPLTTVKQNVVQMARAAVDLAIGVRSEKTMSQEVICPIELIVRQSTAPPGKRAR